MKNKKALSVLEKFQEKYETFTTVLSLISVICLVIMILSTTLDATARFVFNNPVPGMFELNEVILVVCVFMGVAWTQLKRGHIRVEVIVVRFSPRVRHILNAISWLVTLIFVAILCYQSYQGFLESYSIREFRWGSVQMPIWWAKGLIPLGLLLLLVQLVLDILLEIKSFLASKDDVQKSAVREF
jgi:TRAP-type C4-dicarboxylate transport system permease small subunit